MNTQPIKNSSDLSYFLKDDYGNFSALRLIFLTWAIVILTLWGITSYKTNKMQEIPSSVQIVLAALMTGKVVQKFGEGNNPSDYPSNGENPPLLDSSDDGNNNPATPLSVVPNKSTPSDDSDQEKQAS